MTYGPGCICLQEGFTSPACPDYLVSKGIHTMATAKFTPGPWHSMGSTTIEAADEETICLLSAMYRTKKELKANALLIAAAPDLLEALREASTAIREELDAAGHEEDEHPTITEHREVLARVETAISKAERTS